MANEIEIDTPTEVPPNETVEYVSFDDRADRARKASETREADRQIDPKPHKGNERELSR